MEDMNGDCRPINMLGICCPDLHSCDEVYKNGNSHVHTECMEDCSKTYETCPDVHRYIKLGDACHPALRENTGTGYLNKPSKHTCSEQPEPHTGCCISDNFQSNQNYDNTLNYLQKQPLNSQYQDCGNNAECHGVAHKCSLGKIVCCDCKRTDICQDRECITSEPYCPQNIMVENRNQYHQSNTMQDNETFKPYQKPCCASVPRTEQRICRCDSMDPQKVSASCECECGATLTKERKPEKKKSKNVRFADEVKYVDCDAAFESLDSGDAKELCSCCKECFRKGEDECVGRPVLVYELPEPKFEDTTTNRKDYCWHKTPQKEIPPWHPNIKDRWHLMNVPSLAETTYQSDFKTPAVGKPCRRRPVYLAPQKEERDPCQQLAEEFATWKKTSTGPSHVHHSTCPKCDKDLHRVHLHECEGTHLPAQYQCHADGHIGDMSRAQFTICPTGDSESSKYWWKRTCCQSSNKVDEEYDELPSTLLKPACPAYITTYNNDFKYPERDRGYKLASEKCNACDYFSRAPPEDKSVMLCTKDANQPLITQRGAVI